jgi:hypothetical protein
MNYPSPSIEIMKRLILITLYIGFFACQDSYAQGLTDRWSYNTAYTIQARKWECGVLQPFRYGINDGLEVSSYAFLLPLMPNAGLKKNWGEHEGFLFASEHSLSIPSVFLKTISRKGIGGLISPEFDYPFMLGLNNTLFASRQLPCSALLSLRLGLAFTIRTDDVDPLSTIDLPLFYPRMAPYYKGVSIRPGASVKNNFCKRWSYEEGIQFFIATRKDNFFYVENTGSLMWKVGKSLRIKGGYNLSYGQYPFGNHWQIWPTLDLVFGSRLAVAEAK